MLQQEVFHDILMWLRRQQLETIRIATKFFDVAISSMPSDSPKRPIRICVLQADDGQTITADVVVDEGDATRGSMNGDRRKLNEARELALYVRHANITVFSFMAWVIQMRQVVV